MCNSQREQTCQLIGSKQWHVNKRVIFSPLNLSAILDDDLYETRAMDNKVKITICSKADKEDHSSDSFSDEFSLIILAVLFRRRGEKQVDSVENDGICNGGKR